MVKNDGTIEKDYTGNVDLSGYVVVDCKEGVCRQSFGYVKNKNGVYMFSKDSVGQSVTFVGEFNAFGDDDDNVYMILKGNTYVSGGPFEETAKINIRIKRSANYILKDNFYTSGL